MKLVDAYWTPVVNRLLVVCDCGQRIDWPSGVSMVECPECGRAELWHGINRVAATSRWRQPVMTNDVH